MLSVRILGFDCEHRSESQLEELVPKTGGSHGRSCFLPSFRSGFVGLTIPLPSAEIRSLWREGDLYDSYDGQLPEELSGVALDDGNAAREEDEDEGQLDSFR